jgi:hypothetical protein
MPIFEIRSQRIVDLDLYAELTLSGRNRVKEFISDRSKFTVI